MTPPPASAPRWPTWVRDIAGVLWVLGAAAALMAPALVHGTSLGPLDALSQYGLSLRYGAVIHDRQTIDQITEMIPWTSLAWTQVHHGYLPLWNPYSALGMPLAFNWQSASFSIPALAGYLAPLHLAYTVQVLVALVIAGTGVYALGRVLGLGVLGCVMAGTVYELSGPIVGWMGWPVAWVMAWAGWLFVATIWVLRRRRRARAIAFLAVILACIVYAGQPDTMALLGLAFVLFVAVVLVLRAPRLGGSGPVVRPAVDLAVAGLAGAALGAPLLLPGLQLTSGSVRGGKGGSQVLPLSDLVHVIVQGFDGLPIAGSRWFGTSFYVRTASYVGVVAIVLAALGVKAAIRRRHDRPELLAFGAVALGTAAVVFAPPVVSFMDALPSVGPVTWNRALLPMAFALAVLAGVGTDFLVRSWGERPVRRWVLGAFALTGVVLLVVWAFGRGNLPPAEASIRARSFLWPAVATAGSLVAVTLLARSARRSTGGVPRHGARKRRPGPDVGWWAGFSLLAVETALLVSAGAPLPTSSPTFLSPTSAETMLERAVGGSLVGFGTNSCFSPEELGVVPDVNVAFGIRELAVYDPLFPLSLSSSWIDATGVSGAPQRVGTVPFSVFCPAVTSAAVARRYGVGFVLEPALKRGPAGTTFVGRVGGDVLYRVPGAAAATLVPAPLTATLPSVDAPGTPVAVGHPDPAAWRLVTRSAGPAVLRLRLTDVPGWHASVDGRPVALHPYAGAMLQVRVPPGRHTVELRYLPTAFTAGIVLAGTAVVGLVVVPLALRVRRRRRPGALSDPT